MKLILTAIVLVGLTSCGTTATGEKTVFGKTQADWGAIGGKTLARGGRALLAIGIEEYANHKTSAKSPVKVNN